jgi:TolB protein
MSRKRSLLLSLAGLFLLLSLEIQLPAWAANDYEDEAPQEKRAARYTRYDPSRRAYSQGDESTALRQSEGLLDIPPVPYSKIVYEDYDYGEWDIFLADGGFKNPFQLVGDPAIDIQPELNRGCTKVVFASDRTGNFDIYTINTDGSGLTQLTSNATDDVHPSWSPDGTRIVFEAYRDGQAEVYVMNANGSDQTKLTWNQDYDGEPAWSPDGSRIAFISHRTGGYRIWIMNADGSSQFQLNDHPFSSNPTWSPDENLIAFDADTDSNAFMEAWIFTLSNSTSYRLSEPDYDSDYYINGFSPDMTYLSFTQVDWVLYDGQWYWIETVPIAHEINESGGHYWLSEADTIWSLNWQSTDAVAPTSLLYPLNQVSSYQFRLSWNGSNDLPELPYYNLQVKDGINGTWTNAITSTQESSGIFTGLGGQDLYFRLRARDTNHNYEAWPQDYEAHTLIESEPPIAKFFPVPRFFLIADLVLSWNVTDPGSSGVKYSNLQRCIEDEGCATWEDMDYYDCPPYYCSRIFEYVLGETFRYRVRAVDNAENVQDWQDADTLLTTQYSWRVTGTISDHSGAPLMDGLAELGADYLGSELSDLDGIYIAYGGPDYLTSTITWGKDGYLSLPETVVYSTSNPVIDTFLPPLDNLIENWGFEMDGFSGSDWSPGGSLTPTLTTHSLHTGAQAASLGTIPVFTPGEIVNESGVPGLRGAAADSMGSLHFLWHDESGSLYYRRLDPDNSWSEPYLVGTDGGSSGVLGVAPDDTVHVFWVSNQAVLHSTKGSDDTWSPPEIISGDDAVTSEPPGIDFDSAGGIHIVWRYLEGSFYIHSSTFQNGDWSTPTIVASETSQNGSLSVDAMDRVHVIWINGRDGNLNHTWRTLDGPWNVITVVSNGDAGSQELHASPDGSLHITWTDGFTNFYYRRRLPSGEWSGIKSFQGAWKHQLALMENQAFLFWKFDSRLYYSRQEPNGEWTEPVKTELNYRINDFNVSTIQQSDPIIVGINYDQWGITNNLGMISINEDGSWSLPTHIRTESTRFVIPWVFSQAGGVLSLLYQSDYGSQAIRYTEGQMIAQEDSDSTLSTQVEIPLSMEYPVLSYLYNLNCTGAAGTSKFEVLLTNGSLTETLTSTAASTSSWQHAWHALESWKGESADLVFSIHQSAGDPACGVVLDEVTLGSAYPDLWASLSAPVNVHPGEMIAYQIQAGNRGGAPAGDTVLSLTLPPEMTFISADLEPTSVGEAVVWDLVILGGKSEPINITVTARLEDITADSFYLTSSVTISSNTSEMEMNNNQMQFSSYAGLDTYLPLIHQ